jgi:hypothetical protein
MRESLTVEQFITGLNGQELKRFVQFAHPKTLDRAISLALEFESFDGLPNSPRKPRDTEKPPVGFARAILPPVEKNDCNSQITLEKLEETIQQMIQKSLKSMNIQKHERQNDRRPGRNKNHEIVCYTCNEKGHISTKCPNGESRNCDGQKNDNGHLNGNGLSPRP